MEVKSSNKTDETPSGATVDASNKSKGVGNGDSYMSLFDLDPIIAAQLMPFEGGTKDVIDETGTKNRHDIGNDKSIHVASIRVDDDPAESCGVSDVNCRFDDVDAENILGSTYITNEEVETKIISELEEKPEGLFCSTCLTSFEDRKTQVDHYKLDWHRYNLKRSLIFVPPVTLNDFEEAMTKREMEGGELSSISGSDQEEDDGDDDDDVDDDNFEQSNSPKTDYLPLLKEKCRESDQTILARRQKQINMGQNTPGYQRYENVVPKEKRSKHEPKTPDIFQVCSRRSWDMQVRIWRRMLHQYDPPDTPDGTLNLLQDEINDILYVNDNSNESSDKVSSMQTPSLAHPNQHKNLRIDGPCPESPTPSVRPLPPPANNPKLFFRLPDGKVASIYRAFLFSKLEKKADESPNDGAGGGGGGGGGRTVERMQQAIGDINGTKTLVILTGGGHFAAAVFEDCKVVEHKTFHRYVVRQKQGGTQSGKDSCGRAPKSAGASLRRYNEVALAKDIKELIGETWAALVSSCSRIFVRAPSKNRQTFFSGKTSLFAKTDVRVRLIPFLTRRPTFNEVQRVFKVLTSFEIYDDSGVVFGKSGFPKSPPRRGASTTANSATADDAAVVVDAAAVVADARASLDAPAGETKKTTTTTMTTTTSPTRANGDDKRRHRRPLQLRRQENPADNRSSTDEDTDDGDVEESLAALSLRLESLDTSVLKEFDCDLGDGRDAGSGGGGRRRNRKRNGGRKRVIPVVGKRLEEEVDDEATLEGDDLKERLLIRRVHSSFKNDLVTFCRTTDEENFAKVLNKCVKEFRDAAMTTMTNEGTSDPAEDRIRTSLIPRLLNTSVKIGATSQFTFFLHIAAQTGSGGGVNDKSEQKRLLEYLLSLGCDPSKRNSEGKTVYLSTDKTLRLFLRDFRGRFPDKFDYELAEIPAPPSPKEEAEKAERDAERKKKLRKAKKEREKDKKEEKAEEAKKRKEEEEKEEAKRRFLALSDREKRALAAEKRLAVQTNGCWLCAVDMHGLVPFEYIDLKFCSVKCLQEHRKKTTTTMGK